MGQVTLASRVREAFRERGRFRRPKEIADLLGVKSEPVLWALKDMKRRGEVVSRNGWLVYTGRPLRVMPKEVASRIWRAMRISSTWTVQDVVRLAEAREATVKRYLKAWRKGGYVERVALRREGSWTVAVYRVVDRDRREPPPLR